MQAGMKNRKSPNRGLINSNFSTTTVVPKTAIKILYWNITLTFVYSQLTLQTMSVVLLLEDITLLLGGRSLHLTNNY